jgi:hypothetical protein
MRFMWFAMQIFLVVVAYLSHPAIWHHPVEILCIVVEKRESAILAQLVNIAPIQSWGRDVSERTTDWRRIGVNWCGASHCGTRFAGGAVFNLAQHQCLASDKHWYDRRCIERFDASGIRRNVAVAGMAFDVHGWARVHLDCRRDI